MSTLVMSHMICKEPAGASKDALAYFENQPCSFHTPSKESSISFDAEPELLIA